MTRSSGETIYSVVSTRPWTILETLQEESGDRTLSKSDLESEGETITSARSSLTSHTTMCDSYSEDTTDAALREPSYLDKAASSETPEVPYVSTLFVEQILVAADATATGPQGPQMVP